MLYMTSFFNVDQLLPSVVICGTSIVPIITESENFTLYCTYCYKSLERGESDTGKSSERD